MSLHFIVRDVRSSIVQRLKHLSAKPSVVRLASGKEFDRWRVLFEVTGHCLRKKRIYCCTVDLGLRKVESRTLTKATLNSRSQ